MSVLSLPTLSSAGTVTLTNGDVLKGELMGIGAETVHWKSNSLGTLRINKNLIKSILSDTDLKIPGHDTPCRITGIRHEYLSYYCEGDGLSTSSIFTLNNVQTFTKYDEGEYSYKGRASLTSTLNRGNLNQDIIDAHTETTFQRGEFRHVMEAEYEVLNVENEDDKKHMYLRYRLDWFLDEQWFWYNEGELGRDDNRNIKRYDLVSSGAGYQLWNDINGKFDIEVGAEYDRSDYYVTDANINDPNFEAQEERLRLRLGTNFEYALYDKIDIFNRNKLLYALNDADDWELSADTGLSVPITTDLFSELVVEYDYISQPSGGAKSADTKISIGIGYKW